ncbi:MAG: Ig-like domain-containing protein [Candidatus Cloacimonas sp.]
MRLSKLLYYLSYLFILSFIISGCGNKRNPTGGPQDIDKLAVLATSPVEYGDISSGLLEISFSKPVDRNTLANSIYIYPPVPNKKISLDRENIKIRFYEPLKQNTNYFITLTKRLKDLRGNSLESNQTLIFSCGKLATNRLAGTIEYEEPTDKILPVELSLYSPDSLLVLNGILKGNVYVIDNLNLQKHILRTYIDKNLNGRYDLGTEPYFEGISADSYPASLNIRMAYADTTLPKINKIKVVSNRELLIELSEDVVDISNISIKSKESTLPISYQLFEFNKISLLTAKMDSTDYQLTLTGVKDRKNNISSKLESNFKAKPAPDTLAPQITFTNPRNGASINTLSPILEIRFDEIIPKTNIKAKLLCGNKEIPLKQLTTTGYIHRFQPTTELENYKSHILLITTETTDFSGNHLKNNYELQFLPILRK